MKISLNSLNRDCIDPLRLSQVLDKLNLPDKGITDISVLTVLHEAGFNDALWCLYAAHGHDNELAQYGLWCLKQIAPFLDSSNELNLFNEVEKYAKGQLNPLQLKLLIDHAKHEKDTCKNLTTFVAIAAVVCFLDSSLPKYQLAKVVRQCESTLKLVYDALEIRKEFEAKFIEMLLEIEESQAELTYKE